MKRFALAALAAWGLGTQALGQESEHSNVPVDTGERPQMGEVQELEYRQRELYEDIAQDVGVVPWRAEVMEPGLEEGSGTGGSGQGGSGQAGTSVPVAAPGVTHEACAKALQDAEFLPALVTGELRQVGKDQLVLKEANGRTLNLSTNTDTCALRAGQPMPLTSLREGTEVRATYQMEEGKMTARVVRVIEKREPRSATPPPEPMVPKTPRPPETK